MTNIFTTAFVLIAFIATASAYGQCGALENECYTTRNGLQCYLDGQYTCEVDDFTGDTLLAAAGTKSCNNQLYATCAYQCDDGQLALRDDRTCPAPPSCGSDLPCGEACYNPEQFCCINSVPTLLAQCPAVFPTTCSSDSQGCNVTFSGIGQLADGQIRQNFGAGAFEVSFSFDNGKLYDNRGQVCYVTSPENQIQCNYNAQFDTTDGFCLFEDTKTEESFLAYQGTTLFYACAVGTGGYNIYTSNIVGTYCQPIFIELDTQTCPEVIETSSTVASTFATTSSEEEETTSSAAAPTTSEEEDETTSSEEEETTSSEEEETTSSEEDETTSSEEEETTSSEEEEETTSSAAAPTTSSAAAPTTSSAAAPTTSSAAAPTTSSAAAPTTSSAAAPTTSSAAAPTTSSAARPSTSSSPAKSTTTKKDCTTSSKASTKAPSTTKALTTSSKPAASTTGPVNTCVKKPRPVPWCYFDFDFDFDSLYKNKGRCTDRSNKGHHGTFFGQPKGVSALWRLAASFFGTGLQYINIPNADDLGKEFTVATYIKFDALGESVTVANSSAWRVEVCAKSKKIYFHADTTVSWDVTFSTGVYVHVAVSVDAQGYARCYKDGKQCGSAKKTSCQRHKGSLQACRHKGSFKGQFDDFFIFNYCLNIQEIISCKDKERDECATVTASKPSLTTRASTRASTTKAVSTTKAATTKAATTKASTKASTSKDCDKTTSKAPSTTKAATTKASSAAATTKVVVPTTGGKKHCGVPWAYFSCDKTEHTKCGDDSGHGNHGSWFGPVPSQCGGKIRNGLNFAGSYQQAITVPKCGLAQSFTFSSWVKFQVQSSGSCKLASTKSSSTAAAGWELEFNGVTKVLTFYASGSSKATWDCKDLSAGSWFHLAVSVDEDSVEAYVNGNSKGQKTVQKCSQGGSLWIGNNAAKTGQFAGSLDEVCLFDKPLSSEQVAFARDTYNNVQKSSWSWSAQNDWGKDWEKSSLSGYKLARFAQWWNTQ